MVESILIAVAVMVAIAVVFGVILAVAHRFLRVPEDPRVNRVEDMLPGANCGACGAPGCRAFAESVVEGSAQPSGCTVSSLTGINAIARFLGIDAGERSKRVARLHCAGGEGLVRDLAGYQGLQSCAAATLVNGGSRACAWGCLGLADCARACTFDAIHMNHRSLPAVDIDRCTACGDCVDACPQELFTLEPIEEPLIVQCHSPLTGEDARAACAVACDACGRCVLDAGEGVLEMRDGLPRVLEPSQTHAHATLRCPTGAIRWVERNQFETETIEV